MELSEILIGIAEIATALAGFTGVVVVFGSRSHGSWETGDRLRLAFLLEASLTAGGFALLALILLNSQLPRQMTWAIVSALWALFMCCSLYISYRKISESRLKNDDIDRTANGIVAAIFVALIALQCVNVLVWREFAPLLAALVANLAGAAMQFARLIRSAFQS
jgi:hypothetical protein